MALFRKNKKSDKDIEKKDDQVVIETVEANEEEVSTKEDKKETKKTITKTGENLSWVLDKPRITEKTAHQAGDNIFVFNVPKRANKILVKKAIKSLYNVTPKKVNIVVNKPVATFIRGRKGQKSGHKKAIVFLREGDSIDLS